MPVIFYLIPITDPPYDRDNPQGPQYVDALQTNWSGYPLFHFDLYFCQVNTTAAKHALLEAEQGVFGLPDYTLDTVLEDMFPADENRVRNAIEGIGMIYYPTETIEELIHRYICFSEWELTGEAEDDLVGDIPPNSNGLIHGLGNKWGIPTSDAETLRNAMGKHGPIYWNPRRTFVGEF